MSTFSGSQARTREMVAPTIAIFSSFCTCGVDRAPADQNPHRISTSTSILVASLIWQGSAVANALHFIKQFPENRDLERWWNVALFLLAFLIHPERLYDFWKEAPGLRPQPKLLSEMVWPHFWGIQIMLAVLILVYCWRANSRA